MIKDKFTIGFLVFMRFAAASCVLAAAALLMLIGDDLLGLLLAKFMFIFLPAIVWYGLSRLRATIVRALPASPLVLAKAA